MERVGWERQGVAPVIPLNAFGSFGRVHVPGKVYPLTDSFQFALLWAREKRATQYIFPGRSCGQWPVPLDLKEWGYEEVKGCKRGDLLLYFDDQEVLKHMAIVTKDFKALCLLEGRVWKRPLGSLPSKYGTHYTVWRKNLKCSQVGL